MDTRGLGNLNKQAAKTRAALAQAGPARVAWLAGILEGEGSFYWASKPGRRRGTPQVTIRMTDLDVIEEVARLFGGKKVQVVTMLAPRQEAYNTQCAGATAIEVMRACRPWLMSRRGERVDSILAEWYKTYGENEDGEWRLAA